MASDLVMESFFCCTRAINMGIVLNVVVLLWNIEGFWYRVVQSN